MRVFKEPTLDSVRKGETVESAESKEDDILTVSTKIGHFFVRMQCANIPRACFRLVPPWTISEHPDLDPLLQVTAVLWTSDPWAIQHKLRSMEDNSIMAQNMMDAGMESYLEWSMSTNILSAPIESMEKHFPDASLYADQTVPQSSNVGAIVAIVVVGLLLVSGVAVAVFLFQRRKTSAPKASGESSKLETDDTKLMRTDTGEEMVSSSL